MADNSSEPGTSTGSGNIKTKFSGCHIDNFIQNNHLTPSTSNTHAPRRNPINNIELAVNTFIGRETELSDIMQRFHEYPVVVIAAMGGMGKSQLARKFASVNADVYRDRYWINAETQEQLLKSFDRLAKKVKVDANTDIDTVRDTYRSLTAGAALLIFDNVDHVKNVYEYLPTRIKLEDITLHVLVTSRWTEWTSDSSVNCNQLQPLDMSLSLQLFQRKFGQTSLDTMQDEWEELAEMLGYLPLALQVATSYIYKRNQHNSVLLMVLVDYIKQLKEGADVLLNNLLPEYGNRTVYASMMLTLKQLENKAQDDVSNVQNNVQWKFAVTIINAVAYMNPDRIYKDGLLKLIDNHENICKLDEALAILTEYSLLNQGVGWTGDTIYSVHRIIQSSVRHNQTLMGTADMYYIRVLKYALAEDYFRWDVLRYADERASAIAEYYKNNPSPRILKCLIRNEAITAMEAALKLSKNQIQIAMKEHDLLYLAVHSGDLKMTQLLCKYGADINQVCRKDGEPPLHRAVWRGNMEIVIWLLENGATLSLRDREGRNALHVASRWANHKMVSVIIKKDRAVVNETDNDGHTPLHVIKYSDNGKDIFTTTRVLVNSGADITALDKWSNTVLHAVTRSACAAAVSLILQRNKHLINIVNKYGETALHVIPYDNRHINDKRVLPTIHVLLDSGADLTKVDRQGNTVLHSAARSARAAVVSLILRRNKNLIYIKNKDHKTAFHVLGNGFLFKYIVREEKKSLFARVKKTAQVLIMNGLPLDTKDNKGRTPLDTVLPEVKYILLKVAEECNNQLPRLPVIRQVAESEA